MSLCKVFTEFRFILVTRSKAVRGESEDWERTLFVFFIFQSTKFSCYYECIQIKVDPLPIWMGVLLLSVRSKMEE